MTHYHLVTGKLAADAVHTVARRMMADDPELACTVEVLPITVAALMTVEWIGRNLANVPDSAEIVLLPGYCRGDVQCLEQTWGRPVRLGPKEVRMLPVYLGQQSAATDAYGDYDIEIVAEINHAPDRPIEDIVQIAEAFRADGADIIDLGCNPGSHWHDIGTCVRALRDRQLRVSVDSFEPAEIAAAVRAGAELVLSVNNTNRDAATDWDCEVVVIPDQPDQLPTLWENIEFLERAGVRYRVDPILEPIGCGFAASLQRYTEVRRRLPKVEMLMGIGNLTELTDVDSAGMNVLLLGLCQELGIRRVLTTQVINWARSSIRECDIARRMMYFAVNHGTVPKRVDPRLVMLRDARVYEMEESELQSLAANIRDRNVRVFAQGGELHLLCAGRSLRNVDPFRLFAEFVQTLDRPLDASHAFYLGYELAKATTALTLNKQYTQDETLDWGILTRPEKAVHPPGTPGAASQQER